MRYSAALLGLMVSGAASAAPLIDIYAGAYTGYTSLSGDVAGGGREASVDGELGYDKARQTVVYLGIEHPVPVLPNARLRFTSLSESANGTVTEDYTFGNVTFSQSENVASRFDLDYTDLTLYYTPLDLAVKLDVGLTVRHLNADFRIASNTQSAEESITATIPMLHLGAYGKLPLTGFYANGEVNAIGYSGDTFMDMRAGIGWRSDFLLGVELGYTRTTLDFDIDDLKTDLAIGGPYLALSLSF
jgi:outer membrane protein